MRAAVLSGVVVFVLGCAVAGAQTAANIFSIVTGTAGVASINGQTGNVTITMPTAVKGDPGAPGAKGDPGTPGKDGVSITGAPGKDGTNGVVPIYDAANMLLGGVKCVLRTTATTTGGVWTVNYGTLGYTVAPAVIATAQATGSAVQTLMFTSLTNVTAAATSGTAVSAATVSVLGAVTLLPAPAGVTINLWICGKTT